MCVNYEVIKYVFINSKQIVAIDITPKTFIMTTSICALGLIQKPMRPNRHQGYNQHKNSMSHCF